MLALSGTRWAGLHLLWILVIDGADRGLIQIVRGDAPQRLAIGPLTVAQLLCFGATLAAAIGLIRLRDRKTTEATLPTTERDSQTDEEAS